MWVGKHNVLWLGNRVANKVKATMFEKMLIKRTSDELKQYICLKPFTFLDEYRKEKRKKSFLKLQQACEDDRARERARRAARRKVGQAKSSWAWVQATKDYVGDIWANTSLVLPA